MKNKSIRTKRDYETALRTIESLMRAKRGTSKSDAVTVVEAYEAKHVAHAALAQRSRASVHCAWRRVPGRVLVKKKNRT